MKPLVFCALLLATLAIADSPIKLDRICRDGELVGIRVITTGPVNQVIRWPKGICAFGDA